MCGKIDSLRLVPADLRLIEVNDLSILEQLLTGESEPVTKQITPVRSNNPGIGDRKNLAYMSTIVNAGSGKGI